MDQLCHVRRVRDLSFDKHQYLTAAFWADKAVSISEGAKEDIFQLAYAYHLTDQQKRALFILKGLVQYIWRLIKLIPNLQKHTCCKFLAAKCHVALEEWEESLEVIGSPELISTKDADVDDSFSPIPNVQSGIFLLKGIAHEALDNRDRAAECYRAALLNDVYCYEAFDRLTTHSMLTEDEEHKLFNSLRFPESGDDGFLVRYLYSSKVKRALPDEQPAMNRTLAALLSGNAEVQIAEAEHHYYAGQFKQCYDITVSVLDKDPYHYVCLPVHIACQVEIKDTNGLFYLAHKLVDSQPEKAIAWYAVGCYYYLIGNNESARRYFGRASRIDIHFGPAWIGFGHSFAVEGEHDQATAAYSTATRLMSGCHIPLLYIGMEYMATSNLGMANQYFKRAEMMKKKDPAVVHELGINAYHMRKYDIAEECFRQALESSSCISASNTSTDVTFFVAAATALAMTQRKLGRYDDAEASYLKALAAAPQSPKIYAGLGFTYHCQGRCSEAIELYHKALSLKSDDAFCSHMLECALEDEMQSGI